MFKRIPKRITNVLYLVFIISVVVIVLSMFFTSESNKKSEQELLLLVDKNETYLNVESNEEIIERVSENDKLSVENNAVNIIDESKDVNLITENEGENQLDQLGPPMEEGIDVESVSLNSPDSKYCAETYGVNTNVTAGGLYPSKKIRIREISSGNIVWEMTGYYGCSFYWSSDSQKVAISYVARIYGDTVIVDTKDFSEILVPIPEELMRYFRSFRPDSYVMVDQWIDNINLAINITYTGSDELNHSGRYVFIPTTGEVTELEIDN